MILTELVWDARDGWWHGVVLQSIKDATQSIKDATQHMEDLAHVKGVCWCGLIILQHILFSIVPEQGRSGFSKVL